MSERGLSLIEIQRDPRGHYEMFRLVQAMMDYDEAFLNWRFTHMRLAFRIIGSKVLSLKGVPAAQLESGTREVVVSERNATLGALQLPAGGSLEAHKNKYGRDYDPPTPPAPGYDQR